MLCNHPHYCRLRPNTQPGICPVVPERHMKTLDRLGCTITDNHVSRMLVHMKMRINTHYEIGQCSHPSRIRLDLARTYYSKGIKINAMLPMLFFQLYRTFFFLIYLVKVRRVEILNKITFF
jgi:hypothetical protein